MNYNEEIYELDEKIDSTGIGLLFSSFGFVMASYLIMNRIPLSDFSPVSGSLIGVFSLMGIVSTPICIANLARLSIKKHSLTKSKTQNKVQHNNQKIRVNTLENNKKQTKSLTNNDKINILKAEREFLTKEDTSVKNKTKSKTFK